MSHSRFGTFVVLAVLVASAATAAVPSFREVAAPEGWTVTAGQTEPVAALQAKDAGSVQWRTTDPLPLPVEAAFRFRAAVGDDLTCQATEPGSDKSPPLLQAVFRLTGPNQAQITARSSGEPMATTTISCRTWTLVDKVSGTLSYGWRFAAVRSLWDELDRREIGAAYAQLAPLEEKRFSLRLVLTGSLRQIWLDDRLVAEQHTASPPQAFFSISLKKTARILSAEFRAPQQTGPYLPLPLADYSHARSSQDVRPACELSWLPGRVPMWLPKTPLPDIDLNDSLYRYRLTYGSGPDAGYVSALQSWPAAFKVDPASLTFRVPYRHYQAVWLLAWLEDRPHAVPAGTLQFFRENAGYPARTDFEITEEAVGKGLVTKLPQQTAAGKPLYLVRVPVDTDGLYGLRDLAGQFLDFELTKPVALARSHPDPIYYGYHAGGRPSAVHVVGITLEEATVGYEVRPAQAGHVFERPQRPSYVVAVTNTIDRPLTAKIELRTRSFDGAEQGGAGETATVAPHGTSEVNLQFDLKKLGWHEVRVDVEAGGQRRGNTLALVVLPPNARTYGYAPNETRFGIWELAGHYVPMQPHPDCPQNSAILAMYRALGLRRYPSHKSFVTADMLKRHGFLPCGGRTVGRAFSSAVRPDGTVHSEEMQKAAASEVARLVEQAKDFQQSTYFYGGEWHIGRNLQRGPWPRYTGEGDRDLTAEERANASRGVKIFTAIGRTARQQSPQARLALQWGAPFGTVAYLRAGMPRDLVDLFGMDAPQFELLPEISNITGSINELWSVRQETEKLGWPRLPIAWCEGPFFPTNPGALTESEQADYQIRYWLLGLAYGVEQFDAGVVPFDAGNYYGAEHYGAGLFHRHPLAHPKPAAAAVATATTMLCGADVVGPVDTGCLTTYCLALRRAKDPSMLYALWRVNGTIEATLKVRGGRPVVTDAMGNAAACPVKDGLITVCLSSSPVWLTGVEAIDGFRFAAPLYREAPAKVTRRLADMTAQRWSYDGAENKEYAQNHFATCRVTDPNLKAEFAQGEPSHDDAVAVVLPVEPGDRPLATRYGQLTARKPILIPGKARALGLWVKGNCSWGRVVFQCRDAKGESWISVGSKDDWNCDDTHAWSYVSFEGWRYVRFPLPRNQPWDSARELESTWWGCRGGDGIVDLPMTLERIIVEARNEVPYLGQMKLVAERSYKLSGLMAEYDAEEDATDKAVALNRIRQPAPKWSGPVENPIARLAAAGAGVAPDIKAVVEPEHFNDGRRMIIRFDAQEGLTYNLYLSRTKDGRGADLLKAGVKDGDLVTGFRPEIPVYLFLTAVGRDKQPSKPSAAFALTTHDNFAEK